MLNPVFRRESKTFMRSWKSFVGISLYVAVLTGIAAVYITNFTSVSFSNGFNPESMLNLFIILEAFQLLLILLTVPAFTAGSISGERERQTLDLMLVTKATPFTVAAGKFMACMEGVVLMILAGLPVFSIVFYYGGVPIWSLALATLFLLLTAAMTGALSIFLSAVFKRTSVSMVVSYIMVFFLNIGTLICYFCYYSLYWNFFSDGPPTAVTLMFYLLNPAIGFVSLSDKLLGTTAFPTIFDSGSVESIWYIDSFCYLNMAVCAALAVFFIFLASKRLNKKGA